jgi:hypothetical protein
MKDKTAAFDPFAFDWDEQKPLPLIPPPKPFRLSRYVSPSEVDSGTDKAAMSNAISIEKQQTKRADGFIRDFNSLVPTTKLNGFILHSDWAQNNLPEIIPDDDSNDDFVYSGSVDEINERSSIVHNIDDMLNEINERSSIDAEIFTIHEQMSVINNSQTKQCTVKVCGSVSVDPSSSPHHINKSCTLSFDDPKSHILSMTDSDHARKNEQLAFQVTVPESKSKLIEYGCSNKLCPVPLLVKTSVQDCGDHSKMLFQLMVNPRNSNPLVNAAVVVSVPFGYDGQHISVSSVGRSIGKGAIKSNWSGLTRLLSWSLGELYSGAICDFEAVFPKSSDEDDVPMDGSMSARGSSQFPLLLRYDAEGSLLSDVQVKCSSATEASFKKSFRVYHREVCELPGAWSTREV